MKQGLLSLSRLTQRQTTRWLSVSVVSVVVVSVIGCSESDPTATDPKAVFRDGFTSPISAVRIEAEGGTRVRGYDAWLVFTETPEAEVTARFDSEYRPIDCAGPLAYFDRVLASSGPVDRDRLQCRGMTDDRLSFDNGRWLMVDRIRVRYFFRVWKG